MKLTQGIDDLQLTAGYVLVEGLAVVFVLTFSGTALKRHPDLS